MLTIFSHQFVLNALLIGSLCAITAAILGNFVVASRQSIISEMLAHSALAGVGLGIFLEISPNITAILTAIFLSLALNFRPQSRKQNSDAHAMMILTGSIALAILFAHLSPSAVTPFENYLFGSILTVTQTEIITFSAVSLISMALMIIFWRPFITLTFDSEFLASTNPKYLAIKTLFTLIIAIFTALSLKIIGAFLIGALLIIPALTAQCFAKSLKQSTYFSVGFGLISTIFGIILSVYIDVPTSSAIVLSLISLYLMVFFIQPLSAKK